MVEAWPRTFTETSDVWRKFLSYDGPKDISRLIVRRQWIKGSGETTSNENGPRLAMRKMEPRSIFSIANPNKAWVVRELDRLRKEWNGWLEMAQSLDDSSDYDPETCSEAIKDGFANRRKHEILREKTLVFIGNNFVGYEFLFEDWPSPPYEDSTSRLKRVIPGWLHRLETLAASVEYVRVPDGFWVEKGKKLVDKIVEVGPEKGADIAASWLKNPLGE